MPAVLLAGLVLLAGPVLYGAACPADPAGERCNVDTDCDNGSVCRNGFCSELDDVVLDGGPPDGGPADGGPPDAGSDDAGPADAGPCGPGTHDGGDGSCVALDSCVSGFGFLFVDGDGDGVGGGATLPDCLPLPAGEGFAGTGGDCNDDNPDIHVTVSGFADGDGDQFTTGPVAACTDGAVPVGVVATEHLAPVLVFNPTIALDDASGGNDWRSRENTGDCCGGVSLADMDVAQPTNLLTLSGFSCSTLPQRVDLVRVHAIMKLDAVLAQTQVLTVELTLAPAGAPGTTRPVAASLTLEPGDVVIDGTPADWGLTLTPEDVCAGDLEVRLRVLQNGVYANNVGVDTVTLAVEGTDDCDDGDGSASSFVDIYGDADGDGRAGGAPIGSCVGDAPFVLPNSVVPADCDDTDDRAVPGQSNFFATPRNGGGFDFNCNGTEEHRLVVDATACTEVADAGTCDATTTNRDGACGAQIDADDCSAAAPCSISQDTDAIACR